MVSRMCPRFPFPSVLYYLGNRGMDLEVTRANDGHQR